VFLRQRQRVGDTHEEEAFLGNHSFSSGQLEDEFLFSDWFTKSGRDDAGLFEQLALRRLGKRFPWFERTAGCGPVVVPFERSPGEDEPKEEHAIGVIKNQQAG
jgi:hypothetical protein